MATEVHSGIKTVYMTIMQLYEAAISVITEADAMASLELLMPKNSGTPQAWEKAAQRLIDLESFQITKAPEVSRVSLAEGNHRLTKLVWLIRQGHIKDRPLEIIVRETTPDKMSGPALERVLGKTQARYFRFLMDVNYDLMGILAANAYDTTTFDPYDYTLLRELISSLLMRETKTKAEALTDDAETKVFSSLKHWPWKHRDTLTATLDRLVEDAVSQQAPFEQLPELVGVSEIQDIVRSALGTRLSPERYAEIYRRNDNFNSISREVRRLLDSAVRRELYERILGAVEERIQPALVSMSYATLQGYVKLLQTIKEGCNRSGAHFRETVQIIGGRAQTGKTPFASITDAYGRIASTIPEPDRTYLVAHVLDLTHGLKHALQERRQLIDAINRGWKAQTTPEGREKYVQTRVGTDLLHFYALLTLGINMDLSHARQIADTVLGLLAQTDYRDDSQVVVQLCSELHQNYVRSISRDMEEETADPYLRSTASQHLLDSVNGIASLDELLDFLGIDDLVIELPEEVEPDETPAERQAGALKRIPWTPPSEYGPKDTRVITVSGCRGPNEIMQISPKYLYPNLLPDEVRYAVRYFGNSDCTQLPMHPLTALNIIPDQVYVVIPGGGLGVGYLADDTMALLAIIKEPVILFSNNLLVLPPDSPPRPEGLTVKFWFVNLNSNGKPTVFMGNAFDPSYHDGVFSALYTSSNKALAHLYEAAVRISQGKLTLPTVKVEIKSN
ncbi:MAG: hypothetical protein ABIG95_06685 [Candidatus Woesearchaeota archaeon]